MIKKILFPLILLMLFSCARVKTLNLERHHYSQRPNHIVWFQVAGFSEEHIPLLKFNIPDTSYRTSLEKIDCVGKMWNYNLYELRPDAAKSFLSQLNGSKNIKGQCDSYEMNPVWEYLGDKGYFSSILENSASDDQSLEKALACQQNKTIDINKIRLYRMGPDWSAGHNQIKSFHYQDSINGIVETLNPGVYYDKSCQKNICYSSVSNNFKTYWSQIVKAHNNSFFLVRDFNFIKALKRKDVGFAKESLQEIERMIHWLKQQKRNDMLILITGAESINLEYPKEGNEWSEYEKSGKNLFYKTSSLMSPALAEGPMAENFCGIFEESETLKRIIHTPERKQFSWDLLNPF